MAIKTTKINETNLGLPDSDIAYFPDFLSSTEAELQFLQLRKEIPWKQEQVKVFGKWHPQPRLTALTAINDQPYSYSGLTLLPQPMSPSIITLKSRIEAIARVTFTTCLLNLYRDGKDSNGWHADDEKELGRNPVIASVSLGAERIFHLKHRNKKELKFKLPLENGSLLLMAGPTQHHWLHQLPKTSRKIGERINLTFRVIK